jgi:hypothetical protein
MMSSSRSKDPNLHKGVHSINRSDKETPAESYSPVKTVMGLMNSVDAPKTLNSSNNPEPEESSPRIQMKGFIKLIETTRKNNEIYNIRE